MSTEETAQKAENIAPLTEHNKNAQPLPEFTLKNVLLDILNGAKYMLHDPQGISLYYVLTVLAESIINKIIISKVPYTEIDFATYIQQVRIVASGQLNYNEIYGDSGPIVYPAGFIQLYSFLDWIYKSDGLLIVQKLFGYLLTLTVLVYVFVHQFANGTDNTALYKKPWLFSLLLLSKRMHSIYVLRLFNDCFVTFFMGIAILIFQAATMAEGTLRAVILHFGCAVFSYAVSVKMNALLYAPAVLFLIYVSHNGRLLSVLPHVATIIVVQVLVGYNFLVNGDDVRHAYLQNAFDFHRKFLYEWTINWKFLPESIFQDSRFHLMLLVVHVVLLSGFVLSRWCIGFGISTPFKSLMAPQKPFLDSSKFLDSTYVFYVMATSNLIGVLCSRSLHYQFLCWYYFSLPFLYSLTGWNYYFIALFHVAHELCWCTFPSNSTSSAILVTMLSALLLSVWKTDYLKQHLILKEKENEEEKSKKNA